MVLLLYSHVIYTSMTVLNCPSIFDTSGRPSPVREGKGRSCESNVMLSSPLSLSAVVCKWRGKVFHWWPHSSGPTGYSSPSRSCSPHSSHDSALYWTMEEGEAKLLESED